MTAKESGKLRIIQNELDALIRLTGNFQDIDWTDDTALGVCAFLKVIIAQVKQLREQEPENTGEGENHEE